MPKMHADEADIDVPLVRRLLAAQFPEWAGSPVTPVASVGTANAIFRVGDDLAVRLPRIPSAAGQVDKDARWLPLLAPHLPLDVPAPVAVGEPGEGYPFRWAVHGWLPGETAHRLADPSDAARRLGGFVAALQRVDTTGGPAPGEHNFGRGVPLAHRDAYVRDAVAALGDRVDAAAALAAWDAALAAPPHDGSPTWVHGDLQAGNLLARDGRLHAVIDWGGLGVGDPATDLLPAWMLFPPSARPAFRAAAGADDAAWARGRGWALSVALILLPYYWDTNAAAVELGQRTLAAVLADAH